MISAILGRLNHHAIDNGDVEVHLSEYPFEYMNESILDTETTPIKSIDDYEMYQLLELFHSENDKNGFDVDLHMLPA